MYVLKFPDSCSLKELSKSCLCCEKKMVGESNESVRLGMAYRRDGMGCRVLGMIKFSTLNWYHHLVRTDENEMTRICKSRADAVSIRELFCCIGE